MKKYVLLGCMLLCLTGCIKSKSSVLAENLKKIELTGNLVTYQAYYHNVIELHKEAGSGITHWLEKDRKLFAEYTGTIKYGINLSKVKIDVKGHDINVFIPKAMVIGEPNVDKDDFKAENFIESKDSWINANPITADDSIEAFDNAQKEMKENAMNDEELLTIAQTRAKIIIEENITELAGFDNKKYTINWEYEQ